MKKNFDETAIIAAVTDATNDAVKHRDDTLAALNGMVADALTEMDAAQNRADSLDVVKHPDEYLDAVNAVSVAKAKADTLSAKLKEMESTKALAADKYTALKDDADKALTASVEKVKPELIAALQDILETVTESNAQYKAVGEALSQAAVAAGKRSDPYNSPLFKCVYGIKLALTALGVTT